ncbi:uncharacterized protein LOC129892762 [Solanum dulcamara]|uniref:uncharacterized protein LOC129892762 n=1 Tax=Solanum dulcamara TaxID=45834 RepID=UPI002485A230|nr:uncharacterized protein LOC129892762 [Solanum dulcamara]
MTAQGVQQEAGRHDDPDASRVHEFLRMNPPEFAGIQRTLCISCRRCFRLCTLLMQSVLSWLPISSRDGLVRVRTLLSIGKEGKAAMLIGDIDIVRLMIHVQQMKEDKLKKREEFHNKRAKTSNHEFCKKGSGNGNHPSFQQRSSRLAPSSASVPTPRNKNDQIPQNFRT